MAVTPRGTFAASWVGGLVFAFTLIGAISYIDVISSFPIGFQPGGWELTALTVAVVVLMLIDLSALWVLIEIGSLTGRLTFQRKFKHFSRGVAVVTIGIVGSFLFMVLITISAFLIVGHVFK
jgi:hypothetical protein